MKLYRLTCPHCKGHMEMEISEGTISIFCPFCHQRVLIDDEKKETTINKNININKNIKIDKTTHHRYTDDADVIRAKHETIKYQQDFKHMLILFGLLMLIPILIFLGLFLNQAVNQAKGKISAGYYRDLIGKDYETVEAHFESAGFTNIKLINLNDSGLAFWKDGEVDTISIGGDTDFESTDWFDPDTLVVISYH